jgi:hypothetical protein
MENHWQVRRSHGVLPSDVLESGAKLAEMPVIGLLSLPLLVRLTMTLNHAPTWRCKPTPSARVIRLRVSGPWGSGCLFLLVVVQT